MHFCIVTTLAPDGPAGDRGAIVASHRAYLTKHKSMILILGSTWPEDRSKPIGSVYVIEAENWDDARRFAAEDPLSIAGGRSAIDIFEFELKGFDGKFPLKELK